MAARQSVKPVDVLIVTAIAVERAAVRFHLTDMESVILASTVVDVGTLPSQSGSRRVAVIETGPGNVQAGTMSAAPIQQLEPAVVMMVGIAGSLKDLEVGDVVASNKIYWPEPGKVVATADEEGLTRSEVHRRPDIGAVTDRLVQVSRLVTADDLWQQLADGGAKRLNGDTAKAFVAPTVASELLHTALDSPDIREIREHFGDAVAVAMEDYGVARAAAQRGGTAFLSVRSASDKCGNKTTTDAQGSQPLAAANAAAFAFAVIEHDEPLRESAARRETGPAPAEQPTSDQASDRLVKDAADVLGDLYPMGPVHNAVWVQAGGDLASLSLDGSGRAQWVSALRLLQLGGGGKDITLQSLLAAARDEFPKSEQLAALEQRAL